MKLHYFQCRCGNVGDDLNPWLWPRLLPDAFDADESHLFVGIGSILNERLPDAEAYSVVSTGVAGKLPNFAKASWDFVALRGPLSKEKVGVTDDIPLLDGAYLVPIFFSPDKVARVDVGYVPHFKSAQEGLWQAVCEQAGLKLVDPRQPVEKFINELSTCKHVISEAMHGAIIADAYRIPWLPVKAHPHINEFKWVDWTQSLSMSIDFVDVEPTYAGDKRLSFIDRAKLETKRVAQAAGLFPKNWTPPARRVAASTRRHVQRVAETLSNLARAGNYQLSDARLLDSKIDHLVSGLSHRFKIGT